jgi:hypothetical protein
MKKFILETFGDTSIKQLIIFIKNLFKTDETPVIENKISPEVLLKASKINLVEKHTIKEMKQNLKTVKTNKVTKKTKK